MLNETSREVSINTVELVSYVSNTFVMRESNIYNSYPYVRFDDPLNEGSNFSSFQIDRYRGRFISKAKRGGCKRPL